MAIPLTKTLSLADYDDLMPELHTVDRWFTSEQEQNHMRRWEYSLALRAISDWAAHVGVSVLPEVADVGGAGSPFWRMVPADNVFVLDPVGGCSLEDFVSHRAGTNSGHTFRIVTCLSVLEHVADMDQFLYHLSCLVAPGGLLFLTMDAWDQLGPDTAHFNWMRKRIFYWDQFRPAEPLHADFYLPNSFALVRDTLRGLRFSEFGGSEHAYQGATVAGGYTFASLAMVKHP